MDMLKKNKYQLILLAISLIGMITVLVSASQYGLGISPDSVSYLSTAENIARGKGFILYDNTRLILHPPMYPIVLAIPQLFFGINTTKSAIIINAILFGSIIYASGVMFLKILSPRLALLGASSLLISIPLIHVISMAWSEPLFILCTIGNFLAWQRYLERQDWQSLILLSLSVALAILTRYIGIVLLLSTLLSFVLIRNVSRSHMFALTIIAIVPFTFWLARNYFYTKTLFGARSASNFSLSENITFTVETMIRWFIPNQATTGSLFMLSLIVLIGMIIRAMLTSSYITIKVISPKVLPTLHIFSYTLIYISFLTLSSSNIAYDKIDNRLLAPIAIPITFLLLIVVEQLSNLDRKATISRTIISLLIGVIICLSLFHSTMHSFSTLSKLYNDGIGYSSRTWLRSETIRYLAEKQLPSCAMYSNAPDAIYYLSRKQSRFLPQAQSGTSSIANTLSGKSACIVWFKTIHRNYLLSPEKIVMIANLDNEIELNDGTIYFLSQRKEVVGQEILLYDFTTNLPDQWQNLPANNTEALLQVDNSTLLITYQNNLQQRDLASYIFKLPKSISNVIAIKIRVKISQGTSFTVDILKDGQTVTPRFLNYYPGSGTWEELIIPVDGRLDGIILGISEPSPPLPTPTYRIEIDWIKAIVKQ